MLHGLWVLLFGEVYFEIEGGMAERFLNECAEKGLALKFIKALSTGVKAVVPYRSYKTVVKIAEKNKCKITVTRKTGLCAYLLPFKKRYGIALGTMIFAIFLVISQNMVWDIRFYECTQEQEAQLRRSLYEKDIYEGAIINKRQLDKVKKELLIENTAYGWITLNYIKGRIILEKTNATQKPEFFGKEITNVVAAHDGIIRKIDVSGGFLKVCEGQSVAKGDVLVSGIFKDAAGNAQAVHAQGKIYADVEKTYEYIQNLQIVKELPTGERSSFYEIKMLNKSIKLFRYINAPPKSEQKLYRYPLTIFGFHFPATVYEYEVRSLKEENILLTESQAVNIAREKTINAIMNDLAQANIFSKEESVQNLGDKIKYTVKISARADIGMTEIVQTIAPNP